MSEKKNQPGASSARSSERRSVPRHQLESIAYVDLGDTNGGIILNVSENGLAFRAAIPVMESEIPNLQFQLSGPDQRFQAEAKVVWSKDGNRMVGITFVNADPVAIERLRNWIAEVSNPLGANRAKQIPQRRELGPLSPVAANTGDPATDLVADPAIKDLGRADEEFNVTPEPELVIPSAAPVVSATLSSAPLSLFGAVPRVADSSQDSVATYVPEPAFAAHTSASPPSPFRASLSPLAGERPTIPSATLPSNESRVLGLRAPFVVLLAVVLVVGIWAIVRKGSPLPFLSGDASSADSQAQVPMSAAVQMNEIEVIDANGRKRIIPWKSHPDSGTGASATSTPNRSLPPSDTAAPGATIPATSIPSPQSSKIDAATRAPQKPNAALQQRPDFVAQQQSNAGSQPKPRTTQQQPSETSTEPQQVQRSVSQIWSLPQPGQSRSTAGGTSDQQTQLPSISQRSSPAPSTLPSSLSGNRPQPPASPQPVAPRVTPPVASSTGPTSQPSPSVVRPIAGSHAGVLINRVQPIYPQRALAERIEGVVVMQIVVGKDGKVHGVNVLSGPKALVDAATTAVKLWRYEPAVVDGKISESRQYVQVSFKLPVR